MKKFGEMVDRYNTKRRAKKYGRSFEWQDYRDKLAKRLKDGKKEGKTKEELAKILGKEQGTVKYAEMMVDCGRLLDDDLANKLMDSGHLKRVKQNLSKFKPLDEDTSNRIELEKKKQEKEMEKLSKIVGCELEDVQHIKEIGGKLCVKVKNKDNMYRMVRGDELCGGRYSDIYQIKEIGGKPVFKFDIGTEHGAVRGDTEIARCPWVIDGIREDSGKPLFIKRTRDDEGRLRYKLIRGDECISSIFTFERGARGSIELDKIVGGLPVFIMKSPTNPYYDYYIFRGHHRCLGPDHGWRGLKQPPTTYENSDGNLVITDNYRSKIYKK